MTQQYHCYIWHGILLQTLKRTLCWNCTVFNKRAAYSRLPYTLFEELVQVWLLQCATQMRYGFDSKCFCKSAQNKFGSACIRYFTGWKLAGTTILGDHNSNVLDPLESCGARRSNPERLGALQWRLAIVRWVRQIRETSSCEFAHSCMRPQCKGHGVDC